MDRKSLAWSFPAKLRRGPVLLCLAEGWRDAAAHRHTSGRQPSLLGASVTSGRRDAVGGAVRRRAAVRRH